MADPRQLNRSAQGLRVQYIALDNRDSVRVRIPEPSSAPQVQRQGDVGVLQQKRDRIPRELSGGAKNENLGHTTSFQRPTIFCSCSG
jgi:hypothetical protein